MHRGIVRPEKLPRERLIHIATPVPRSSSDFGKEAAADETDAHGFHVAWPDQRLLRGDRIDGLDGPALDERADQPPCRSTSGSTVLNPAASTPGSARTRSSTRR